MEHTTSSCVYHNVVCAQAYSEHSERAAGKQVARSLAHGCMCDVHGTLATGQCRVRDALLLFWIDAMLDGVKAHKEHFPVRAGGIPSVDMVCSELCSCQSPAAWHESCTLCAQKTHSLWRSEVVHSTWMQLATLNLAIKEHRKNKGGTSHKVNLHAGATLKALCHKHAMHSLPFQSLGRMHRHHMHHVPLARVYTQLLTDTHAVLFNGPPQSAQHRHGRGISACRAGRGATGGRCPGLVNLQVATASWGTRVRTDMRLKLANRRQMLTNAYTGGTSEHGISVRFNHLFTAMLPVEPSARQRCQTRHERVKTTRQVLVTCPHLFNVPNQGIGHICNGAAGKREAAHKRRSEEEVRVGHAYDM